MKTIFAITTALIINVFPATAVEAQLPVTSPKKQTSDPYFSTPNQMAVEANANTAIQQPATTSDQPEIWKSLSRKTTKPIQRIDFSELQVNPAVKSDLLKTAAAWNAPAPKDDNGPTTAAKNGEDISIDFSAPATLPVTANSLVPTGPLSPLPPINNPVEQPKPLVNPPAAKSLAPEKMATGDFQSTVQQVTYQQPVDQPFVPGQNIQRFRNRLQELSTARENSEKLLKQKMMSAEYRIADSTGVSSAPASPMPSSGSGSRLLAATPSYSNIIGESFEPSRVVAIVGGEPIFVGEMIFEINQLIEKYMSGAPEAAKEHQRGNLIKRLLPKYVDQKMLFLSTTRALPEGADLEDVIAQAEKTFNEQALPDLMKNSGIESTAQFDANLRAQGSSIRQMRRSWAKDQVGRYLLAEKVNVNTDVTHQELLDNYHQSIDSYAHNAKCRWEKIELKFSRSGGRFAAKDKMDDIYQRIVHGGNFQAIAKQESHGFRAPQGGQHDWTNRGSLVSKKVDKAIFTLPLGTLSEIIETKDSFIVVRVIERIDAYHTPFEETQNELKQKIISQRRDREFKKYLDKIRQTIPVEYPNG